MVVALYRWPRYFRRYAALPNFSFPFRLPPLCFLELRACELRRELLERRLRFLPVPCDPP